MSHKVKVYHRIKPVNTVLPTVVDNDFIGPPTKDDTIKQAVHSLNTINNKLQSKYDDRIHSKWTDYSFESGEFKTDNDCYTITITSAKCENCQRYSVNLMQYSPEMPMFCSNCGAIMDK